MSVLLHALAPAYVCFPPTRFIDLFFLQISVRLHHLMPWRRACSIPSPTRSSSSRYLVQCTWRSWQFSTSLRRSCLYCFQIWEHEDAVRSHRLEPLMNMSSKGYPPPPALPSGLHVCIYCFKFSRLLFSLSDLLVWLAVSLFTSV